MASVATVTTTWTIGGVAASATSCTGIDHLQVDYLSGGQDLGGFAPVLCTAGSIRWDNMPPGIDTVRITEIGPSGGAVGAASGSVSGPAGAELSSVSLPAPL